MLNNYLSLSSPSPEVCGSVKALCKSVPSWAPVFISFPFPWRSSHFFPSLFFLVSVSEEGWGCIFRESSISEGICFGFLCVFGIGCVGCFLLNCPIYFGKQKLHCFVNCISGFLHVQIHQLFGGFNQTSVGGWLT